MIHGKSERLGETNTKEACAITVHSKYPNASGVEWDENNSNCEAKFGNSVDYFSDEYVPHPWACIINGKKSIIFSL